MEDGTKLPYWTRTPEPWDSFTVVIIGTEVVGSTPADISLGVRPAFCMKKSIVVKQKDDVIKGEKGYVIE